MNDSDTKLDELQSLTIKDFDLSVPESNPDSLEYLIDWLTNEIAQLIDRDFNKLLNMLYRIDVNEQKAKKAFADAYPAREIAILIIEREKQKVETRAKYKH